MHIVYLYASMLLQLLGTDFWMDVGHSAACNITEIKAMTLTLREFKLLVLSKSFILHLPGEAKCSFMENAIM